VRSALPQKICLLLSLTLALAAAHATGQAAAGEANQRQTALDLEQQGKNAEAEAAWRLYLKAHPSSPEPYAHLGLLEARQEHYAEAAPLYRKALALNPAIPGLQLNLGLALFKGGELKQAIVEFKSLLKSQGPAAAEGERLTILIGMAHYGLAEYAEAVPYFQQAAARDTQNLPLRLALAHSCLWSRQYQCVVNTNHEILSLNAESAEADMLVGEALDEMKDRNGAMALCDVGSHAIPGGGEGVSGRAGQQPGSRSGDDLSGGRGYATGPCRCRASAAGEGRKT
jgi:tetratricopeptide (TPR) repeat protein